MKKIAIILLLFIIACNKREVSTLSAETFKNSLKRLDDSQKKFFLDSLFIEVEQIENDSARIDLMLKISSEYFFLKDYSSSQIAARSALKVSKKIKDSINIGKALYYLGDCYFDFQKDSAYFYYKESEKIYKKIKDYDRLAKVFYNKAYLLFYEGNYIESEIEVSKALQNLNKNKKLITTYRCYSLQGSNHLELGEYDKAQKYFDQSSLILKKMSRINMDKDSFYDYNVTNAIDICNVYDKKGEYSKSIKKLKEVLKEIKSEKFPDLYYSVMGNLAYSLMKGKRYGEAKKYFEEAISLTKKNNDQHGYLYKIIDYGEYHLLIKDSTNAQKLFSEALLLSKKLNSSKEILKTLDFLSIVDKNNSINYKTEYIKTSDSIFRKQRRNREKFARIEFETDEVLEANKVLTKNSLILLLILALSIMGFVLILTIRNRIIREKEVKLIEQKKIADDELLIITKEFQSELIKAKKEEQNRISKELHDGIVNQIYGIRMILGSLNSKNDEISQTKRLTYIKELHKLETEIRTLSHELNTDFDRYKGEFKFLIEKLIDTNNSVGNVFFELKQDLHIDWNKYSSFIRINVYRIMQELFLNINKHSGAKKCVVSITLQDNSVIIHITDDGIGFDIDNKQKNGVGLKNIIDRSKAIQAEIYMKSNKNGGTETLLKLKSEM